MHRGRVELEGRIGRDGVLYGVRAVGGRPIDAPIALSFEYRVAPDDVR